MFFLARNLLACCTATREKVEWKIIYDLFIPRARLRREGCALKVPAIYRTFLIVYANPCPNSVKNTPLYLNSHPLELARFAGSRLDGERRREEKGGWKGKRREQGGKIEEADTKEKSFDIPAYVVAPILFFHEAPPPLIYLNLNLTRNTGAITGWGWKIGGRLPRELLRLLHGICARKLRQSSGLKVAN